MPSTIQRLLKQQGSFSNVQEEVFLGLQIAADRLMAPWAAHLRKHAQLTPVQYNLLRILRGAGEAGLLAGEIGERMITRSPDVTRLIDRLEERGLVARCAHPADRRAVRVTITAAGKELIAPLDGDATEMLRQSTSLMPEPQVLELRDHLAALLEALELQK